MERAMERPPGVGRALQRTTIKGGKVNFERIVVLRLIGSPRDSPFDQSGRDVEPRNRPFVAIAPMADDLGRYEAIYGRLTQVWPGEWPLIAWSTLADNMRAEY